MGEGKLRDSYKFNFKSVLTGRSQAEVEGSEGELRITSLSLGQKFFRNVIYLCLSVSGFPE